jgi:hypothetical protein
MRFINEAGWVYGGSWDVKYGYEGMRWMGID